MKETSIEQQRRIALEDRLVGQVRRLTGLEIKAIRDKISGADAYPHSVLYVDIQLGNDTFSLTEPMKQQLLETKNDEEFKQVLFKLIKPDLQPDSQWFRTYFRQGSD